MNDCELVQYCVSHSRTSVGAIDGSMFARLHELAGEPDEVIRQVRSRHMWRPDPEWVDRLATQARVRMAA